MFVLFLHTGSCFPSLAKVMLRNGKSIRISELKVGDQVRTGKWINLILSHIKGIGIVTMWHMISNEEQWSWLSTK